MKRIHVWISKEAIEPELLKNATAVVMDVLLATTTLITMLENGAKAVYPVSSYDEALQMTKTLPDSSFLTGGEEDGAPIQEFHCGPFPEEFTSEKVNNKDVVFLTTNGTRAIKRAANAEELLIASLRNAPATAAYLREKNPDAVYLICAGSKGHVSLEDTLCAGYILSLLDIEKCALNDAAVVARELAISQAKWPVEWLKESRVGKWFESVGKQDVLNFVADVGASSATVSFRDGKLHRNP